MRLKFNKFERVAGLFVLTAIIGSLSATVGIAIQKGWFSSKVSFYTTLESAEGIHSGTVVQVAGLRAGSVESVELISANEVRVEFQVLAKFHERIRKDSELQVIRPFIIGEKVFSISVGSDKTDIVQAGSMIVTSSSFDVMDVFSGRKIAPFIGMMDDLLSNLRILVTAFADKSRMEEFVKMFDRLSPLVKNLNTMSQKVSHVTDIATEEERLQKMMSSLVILTTEFEKLAPAISEVAPQMPEASLRALEALDETVITLKALQKSFLLSGKVEDVRKEELKRKPAGKK